MFACPYQSLLQQLDETSLVLTVNQRLAAYLQEINAQFQIGAGHAVWAADQILSLSAYLENLWQAAWLDAYILPLVLTSEQEQVIWQEIITAADTEGVLLSSRAAAKLAARAWRMLCEWNLSITDIADSSSEDVLAFAAWARAFQARCAQKSWVSEAQRVPYISSWLQQAKSPHLPKTLYLVGFSEHTPQWQQLLQVLAKLGVNVLHWQLPSPAATVEVLACQDDDSEYRTALQWAYQAWQTDPKVKLAIIMPQLQNQRLRIERLADEFFNCPDRPALTYALSGGSSLLEQPIIYDAWLLLQLNSLSDYENLSRVIRSPFIATAEDEHAARDRLDRYLREQLLQNADLTSCLNLPGVADQCPLLWQILTAYQQYTLPKSAAVAVWARHWLNVLNLLGWPGQRQLNSHEYQAVASFYQCLEKLATSSLIAEHYPQAKLFAQFTEKLRATVFQAQSPAQPVLQILGVLESAGLIFDQIWLCGLHEQEWPAPARPNPFLPISLQRKTNMPHASAERELKFAQTLFADLQKQCQLLRVSYPCWQGDIALAPSPLLRDYPVSKSMQLPWRYACQQSRANLELISDTLAPPLSFVELSAIEGGYKIFQQQALCPFQAFASRRMKVSAFPEFMEYLDNRIRGTLLHGILERIWREIQSQQRLLAMADVEKQTLVSSVVSQQLRYWQQRYPELLTRALVDLEQQRLDKLLMDWLAIEAERPPFTVAAQEETFVSELSGIPLKMRIDRIDALAGGEKVVIDYKTGLVNCKDWFGTRPTDPQLPIYALLTKAQAIVYAQLRSGKLGFYGVADAKDYLANVAAIADSKLGTASDWPMQLAEWQAVLDKLATEFKQGEASVTPKSVNEACRNCDLQALCRINEIELVQAED